MVLLACALFLTGCSLATEQLLLPSPVNGASGPTGSIASGNRHSVALGDPASPGTTANRLYPGSAQFTKMAQGQSEPRGIANKTISGDGISLELVGASIPDAAKAVLGDVLSVNYVVSDKVKGAVTLKTSKPVSRDGLLEIFESVLAAEGVALVVDGPIFRIMPREDALAEGRPIKGEQNFAKRTAGMSTEIVPLKFVSAAEMERILKSVAPQSVIRHVDTARNLLVISGSRAELQSMSDTVSVFDVDWMRNMSFGIFPLETSDAEAIAQELDKIFANDGSGGPSKGIVRFIPNARLKSIVVISSRPEYLKKAETWIKRIDMANEATEQRAFVYHVQHRPAQELADLLKKVYSPSGGGSRDQDPAAQQGLVTGATTAAEAPPSPSNGFTADQTRPLAANEPRPAGPLVVTPGAAKLLNTPVGTADASGSNAEAAASGGVSGSGSLARAPLDDRNSGISVVADEGNNTLVITATPSEARRIRQILQQVDVLAEQVLLEATIAEVTLNDDLKFGMRWFFEKGASEIRLTDATAALGAFSPVIPGFSYFFNTPNVRVVLNALNGITHVNLVSSPSLMTLNNKRATLQIGDEVPIATQSAISVVSPGAPVVNSISFRNTGVILSITPRVADNGQVLLEIEQEVSDVKATTSSKIDSPTIQQRRIKTTVSVNNGGSVILAGLMRDKATRKNNQVPLVGDIPLVGNLFKDKDDTIERTELLIAITPQVIKDNSQLDLVASEFRDRMNFTTRPQRETGPDHRETLDRLAR
jgi:general secretion pathway protein D